MLKKLTWKKIITEILWDIIGSLLIAIGIYNFAAASEFPVTGISGIALVIYYYWGLPIGTMTFLMNIPVIIICSRILGITTILRSFKTMLISTFFIDLVAPLFPVYQGNIILSCVCMGIISGIGYATMYIRNTSAGGMDFVSMSIQKKNPKISLGKIIAVIDCSVLFISGMLTGGKIQNIICGLVATCILSVVVDTVMLIYNSSRRKYI